ncbi:MAG: type II toxin-antitoxin system RelE/ParE family toxin [Pseudomonadota bacterium]
MQLKWTELAAADLDHIEEYIARNNSPVVAIEVVLRVINSTETILSNHPTAGRLGRVKGTRELVINDIPFIVIYRQRVAQSQIQIIRVLHDAQQWPGP